MSSLVNCEAIGGSVTAEGNETWGFGAVCGTPWGAPEITGCKADGTGISVTGENNRLVGGLVGFGGSYDPTAPAQITGCAVKDVTVTVSETTDSVGGLIGAGKEMMEGSDTQAVIYTEALDLIPEARELAKFGLIPAGAYRNRIFAEKTVELDGIELCVQDMLFDPQTSGGLLIACAPEDADRMYEELKKTVPSAQRIGTVQAYEGGKRIFLR